MLFATPGQSIETLKDYWPWFVILALCLVVAEIAVRQVLLPASWTARWQRRKIEGTAPDEGEGLAIFRNGIDAAAASAE